MAAGASGLVSQEACTDTVIPETNCNREQGVGHEAGVPSH